MAEIYGLRNEMLGNISNCKIGYYYSIIYYYALASRNRNINSIRSYSKVSIN